MVIFQLSLWVKNDELYKKKNILDIDTGAGHNKFLSLIDLTNAYQYSVKVTDTKKSTLNV